MHRNLHNRVEAICPVEDRPLRQRLWTILQTALEDRRRCWDMNPDGTYTLRMPEGVPEDSPAALGTHQTLINQALESARGNSSARKPANGGRRAGPAAQDTA